MRFRLPKRWLPAIFLGVLAVWAGLELSRSPRSDIRDFDPHAVARIETAMWRSYYDHHSLQLFVELTDLLRSQYHLPFWWSCVGAYHAARAAVVFQRGHNREEYGKALPSLESFYGLIRAASTTPFSPGEAARLELEWWIVHRERARHPAGDLEKGLADLQAQLYQQPATDFAEHARARAEAMLLRDRRAEEGGVSDADWAQIASLLDRSWVSLSQRISKPRSASNVFKGHRYAPRNEHPVRVRFSDAQDHRHDEPSAPSQDCERIGLRSEPHPVRVRFSDAQDHRHLEPTAP